MISQYENRFKRSVKKIEIRIMNVNDIDKIVEEKLKNKEVSINTLTESKENDRTSKPEYLSAKNKAQS